MNDDCISIQDADCSAKGTILSRAIYQYWAPTIDLIESNFTLHSYIQLPTKFHVSCRTSMHVVKFFHILFLCFMWYLSLCICCPSKR